MPIAKKTEKINNEIKSERLILSEHIAKCANTMERFLEATDQFQEYKTGIFDDLDRKIEAKKQELEDVKIKINREQEEARITTQQKLQEFKFEGALEILEEFGKEAIDSDELQKMKNELENLKLNNEDILAESLKKLSRELETSHKFQLNNLKLQHEAETATLKATSDQRIQQIEVLTNTITDLKHELAEQRELTKSVASSLKQGAITLNTGKN